MRLFSRRSFSRPYASVASNKSSSSKSGSMLFLFPGTAADARARAPDQLSVTLLAGQGSQFVGMGRDLIDRFPEAKATLEEADAALRFKLSALMFHGPADELARTVHTQPAIVAHSVAVFRSLKARGAACVFASSQVAIGHSIGEFAALAATGALPFQKVIQLVAARGRAMQDAVPEGVGGMIALMPITERQVRQICEQVAKERAQVCSVANINSDNQIVISGHREAMLHAAELARQVGVRRATLLSVSAPFHCALMRPAAERFDVEHLSKLTFAAAQLPVPLYSNVDARRITDTAAMHSLLRQQMEAPVRFGECVRAAIRDGCTSAVELGPSDVLTRLVKRIDPKLSVHAIGTAEQLEREQK